MINVEYQYHEQIDTWNGQHANVINHIPTSAQKDEQQ